MSLMIQDDLCIVRSDGDQELIAACVCSPSYWDVQSKIGKSLHNIHDPVSTLNEKIGERISKFIRQSPSYEAIQKTKLACSRRHRSVSFNRRGRP